MQNRLKLQMAMILSSLIPMVAGCAGNSLSGGQRFSGSTDLVPELASFRLPSRNGSYDPLALSSGVNVKTLDLTIHDSARSRDIPVRVYLPSKKFAAPVVLFSHGLGGSREGSVFLGKHWAARGYVAVFLQHPGSDTSVWKGQRPANIMSAMRKAASAENYLLRIQDVTAVLDTLVRWNRQTAHPLSGRLDLKRIGMSGHSFGALTTQAVSGQKMPIGNRNSTDPRIRAAIIFSPSVPKIGNSSRAFGSVRIPWMLMTGTQDVAPIGASSVEERLAVYPALPPGGKYELVLNGAQHSVFTDRALPGDRGQRNPNHHRVILALSTAFLDAYLKNDAAARSWLNDSGPSSLLEAGDHWQHK